MNTSKGIKLTPKGKRFGDVVRKQLENPDSIISKAVRNLKAWQRLCDSNPRRFKLVLDPVWGICAEDAKRDRGEWPERICKIDDVSYWYSAEI